MAEHGNSARGASWRLPDFIAVGPPRTGTTWLHSVLRHCACVPELIKETHFFDLLYSKGLQWYSAYFRRCDECTVAGELTPTYFSLPQARERIARHLPNCRIICTFRDPVERAWSAYRMLVREGRSRRGFEEEVMQPGSWISEGNRYALHLRAWQKLFGLRNVGTFFYDDLKADEQAYVDSVCRFLDVPPIGISVVRHQLMRNPADHRPWSRRISAYSHQLRMWLKSRRADRTVDTLARFGVWRLLRESPLRFPPLEPGVEARMRKLFLPEVEALEDLVARDLSAWKTGQR